MNRKYSLCSTILTEFWDKKGVHVYDYMIEGTTTNKFFTLIIYSQL